MALRSLVLLACCACVKSLVQRVALVTGANKGIGLEIARALGSVPEHLVVLACRDQGKGVAAMEELRAAGCDCVYSRLDLTDWDSICATRDFIARQFGRLDALVNNAGIRFNDPTMNGKFESTPFAIRAQYTIDTNYYGTLSVTDAMLPLLRESDWSPRIVNLASPPSGLTGSADVHNEISSPALELNALSGLMNEFVDVAQAGKSAPRWPNIFGNTFVCHDVSQIGLEALTRVLAKEEPTIMVNSVDPGSCSTEYNNYQGAKSAAEGAIMASNLAYMQMEGPDNFVSGEHFI